MANVNLILFQHLDFGEQQKRQGGDNVEKRVKAGYRRSDSHGGRKSVYEKISKTDDRKKEGHCPE